MTVIDDVVARTVVPDLARWSDVVVPAVNVSTLLAASVSVNTACNYRQGRTRSTTWCTEQDLVALPAAPATVAAYLQAQVRTETGERRYAVATAAITQAGGGGPATDPRSAPIATPLSKPPREWPRET